MTDSSDDSKFKDQFPDIDRGIDDLHDGNEPHADQSTGVAPDGVEELLPTMRLLADAGRRGEQKTLAARHAEADLTGAVLGDYRILREIGRGRMGLVFEAVQISLDRRVALKVLSLTAMRDDEKLARFEREAQAAASLEHPRIVRAYARGEDRGIYCLAMQYVDERVRSVEWFDNRNRIVTTSSDTTIAWSPLPINRRTVSCTSGILAEEHLRNNSDVSFR